MKCLILIFFPVALWAQEFEFQFEPEAFPVEIDGWQPFSPWAGGFTESAPEFVDIDSDGDLDLLVGEYFGHPIPFFRNYGNQISPNYDWEGSLSDSLRAFDNESRTNVDFYDLDGDNDLDALIGCSYVTYVENTGTATQPDFNSNRVGLLDTSGNWVFGTHVALLDIDVDGDGDLICGEYQGHLQFYRNVGTPDSLAFHLEDDLWLSIDVGGYADPTFCDIDADNDLDLFIGERYGRIWYYRNDGDSMNYDFTYVTDYFDSIDVGDYASPEFADIDGDGDYDLFVGREPSDNLNLLGDVFFYENVGTPTNAQFEFITRNYLTIDVGWVSINPQVVDLNADRAPDLMIGATDILTYFENVGDSTHPSFNLIDEQFQGIERQIIKPFFVDIDADSDLDMFAGEGVIPGPPTVALYLNQGTPRNPQLVLHDPNYISNPDFFVNTNPGLADIDADEDYDLFITDDHGHFFFYRNDGNSQWPNFFMADSQWQGIQFTYPYDGWRGFSFGDLDEDGDLDLLMENLYMEVSDANLRFYRNIGSPQVANMSLETETLLPGYTLYMACPYLIDIDLDGDLDIFCGEGNGGTMFFRNVTGEPAVPPVHTSPYRGPVLTLGPNPANPVTWVTFNLPAPQKATLAVYNLLGRKVATLTQGLQPAGTNTYLWNASQFSSGVYVIRLEMGKDAKAGKVMILR